MTRDDEPVGGRSRRAGQLVAIGVGLTMGPIGWLP